jgi:hypothetical protein
LETEAQDALKAASDNFPGPLGPVASFVMKAGCFPLGNLTRPYTEPSDTLTKEVSRLLTTPSGLRDMFAEGIYTAPDGQVHQVTDLMRALPICVEADRMRDVLIQVDVFDHLTEAEGREGYTRPAIVGTEERLAAMERKTFAA